MDGSVKTDGKVGTWGWAETASKEKLMSWLTDSFDGKRSQDIAVLVKVGERLDKTTQEIVDIIYPG